MVNICLYFQVHQPKRLRRYTFFDIGHEHYYEDDQQNQEILLKVAKKCYLPTNELLFKLIKQYRGRFKVTFSITGSAIDQFKRFSPETLYSFQQLADTGCVEILNETYNHSLSFLYSKETFRDEVMQHHDMIQNEFGQKATTFRNTELIYNNDLAQCVESLGFSAILAEGFEPAIQNKNPRYLYYPEGCSQLKLFLRDYQLSDDIAFRFSNSAWSEFPLTAAKFANWIQAVPENSDIINLFMDYETFGEHQWAETGIFSFLEALPAQILNHSEFHFCTPRDAVEKLPAIASLDIPIFYSWADSKRDLTAWRGNHLQDDALESVYALEKEVKATADKNLIAIWHSLLISDHFYYMCTKQDADSHIHQYFNPYRSPYDAFINYQNILKDFVLVLRNQLDFDSN